MSKDIAGTLLVREQNERIRLQGDFFSNGEQNMQTDRRGARRGAPKAQWVHRN